jgi:hypothetical protein
MALPHWVARTISTLSGTGACGQRAGLWRNAPTMAHHMWTRDVYLVADPSESRRWPSAATQRILYQLVRQNLESFLAYAREHYDGGLPHYVERELRAYLSCGVFSEGFVALVATGAGTIFLSPSHVTTEASAPAAVADGWQT